MEANLIFAFKLRWGEEAKRWNPKMPADKGNAPCYANADYPSSGVTTKRRTLQALVLGLTCYPPTSSWKSPNLGVHFTLLGVQLAELMQGV